MRLATPPTVIVNSRWDILRSVIFALRVTKSPPLSEPTVMYANSSTTPIMCIIVRVRSTRAGFVTRCGCLVLSQDYVWLRPILNYRTSICTRQHHRRLPRSCSGGRTAKYFSRSHHVAHSDRGCQGSGQAARDSRIGRFWTLTLEQICACRSG